MKKIVSLIAAVAALGSVSTAFSQVKENKEVTHMGAGVVANQNTSYSPTVTQLGGNVVEYREYTPEFSLSLLGVSAAVGYESEYVFRGEKRSGHAIQPKVEFSYPLYALDLYAGAWYSSPIKGTSVGEMSALDAYVGAVYYYKDMRVDVGYIYYWYPDSASSQFFIVHEDSTFLDGQYAAFGHVTDGMDVVDAICEAVPVQDNNGTVAAADQPVITAVTVVD